MGSSSSDRRLRRTEGHLAGVLLLRSAPQAHRAAPGWGPPLQIRASGAQRGTWVGSSPQIGASGVCSAADAGVSGERGYGDGSTPYT